MRWTSPKASPRGTACAAAGSACTSAAIIGLDERQSWELYYTLLLKDLGCSSNAARICELYLADDLQFKRDFKSVGDSLPQVLRFVFSHTGLGAGMTRAAAHHPEHHAQRFADRARADADTLHRGADIARSCAFPTRWPTASQPGRALERPRQAHGWPARRSRCMRASRCWPRWWTCSAPPTGPRRRWRGARPRRPMVRPGAGRGLRAGGREAAVLVGAGLADLDPAVLALEPGRLRVALDDDYLDDIAAAFGQVVDSKSPFTSGHSTRVAHVRRPEWLRRWACRRRAGAG